MKMSTLVMLLSALAILLLVWSHQIHQQNLIPPAQYELESERDGVVSNQTEPYRRLHQKWPGPARTRKDAQAQVDNVSEPTDDQTVITKHCSTLPPEFLAPERASAIAAYFRELDIAMVERSRIPRFITPLPDIETQAPTMEDVRKVDAYLKKDAENGARVRAILLTIDRSRVPRAEAGLRAALGDEGFEAFQRFLNTQRGHFAETPR